MTTLSGEVLEQTGGRWRPARGARPVVVFLDPHQVDTLGLTAAQRRASDINEAIEAAGVDSSAFSWCSL